MGESWDDLDVIAQAELLAYYQIREMEIAEEKVALAKAMTPQL